MSTKKEFSYREPGKLQTGLNPLWKMVREEPFSSRRPRFTNGRVRGRRKSGVNGGVVNRPAEPAACKGAGNLGGNT
ncbi:MAG: hypothetical protein E7L01_01285 [Paenibacillus macerans]|uniref:hypothetical protein n=1 Tax=Paenibacillus macerans TaxID=44252 RepID=UPI000FD6CA6C|nr:hypothetical protein [Paenibacillus macerans]MCY7560402.1 hypothetical protein [Paenibacillus macerans]MDU7471980.1 hypothetical protein [Paenibacillus macerans]MEC0141680.1 hypothetical protein [Paenibacillus macerans]MEC0153858.1 hypothetical protein [Paenibacillus macerans]MEC0331525.1 hypothetical protein [Paenibacillus macerans]